MDAIFKSTAESKCMPKKQQSDWYAMIRVQTKHMEICMTPTTTMPKNEGASESERKKLTVHI